MWLGKMRDLVRPAKRLGRTTTGKTTTIQSRAITTRSFSAAAKKNPPPGSNDHYIKRTKELRKELGVTLGLSSETQTKGPPMIAGTAFPAEALKEMEAIDGTELRLQNVFESNPVTLILTSSNAAARMAIPGIRDTFCEAFKEILRDPSSATVEVSFQSSILHRMIRGLLSGFLRNATDAAYHSSTALVTDDMFSLETKLGMIDRHSGYAYLVDGNGRVRWSSRCRVGNQDEVSKALVREVGSILASRPNGD